MNLLNLIFPTRRPPKVLPKKEYEQGNKMAEQATIQFDRADEKPKFTILHFGAGGERGILSFGYPIFLEEFTGIPLSKLFNRLSGMSAGAVPAAMLSARRFEDKDTPRFSALDVEEGMKQIVKLGVPPRLAFMFRRSIPLMLQFVHESEKIAADYLSKKADHALSVSLHFIGRKCHALMRSTSHYAYQEFQPFKRFVQYALKPANKAIDTFLENWMSQARYDIRIIHQALNLALRTEDTDRPLKLEDALTSLHISAFNYTRDEPAHFSKFQEYGNAKGHVSDPGMGLDDIIAGSCAAPGYFDYHVARNGEYYMDIGHLDNTPFTSVDDAQDHLGNNTEVNCLKIGTGYEERVMKRVKINNPVHLIVNGGQSYFEKRDTKALIKKLGKDNLRHIDISLSPATAQKKYADNPKLVRAASLLGFNLLARDQMDELDRLPSSDKFANTSPESIEVLSEFKWDMLWHNFDTAIEHTKFIVKNASKQGHIPQDRAREIIEDLEWLYPTGAAVPAEDYVPHRPIPNLREAKSNLCIELAQRYSWRKQIVEMFNKSAQGQDTHKKERDFFTAIRRQPANDDCCAPSAHSESCPKVKDKKREMSP